MDELGPFVLRRDKYHETFVQEIPIFYDTLLYISSIATGDMVQKISIITLYHRLIPGERDDILKSSKIPIFYYTSSMNRSRRTRCIDQQQQRQ